MEQAGLRAELDLRNEKIGFKVREAQVMKIPYMLVIGDREAESGTVSVRTRRGETLGPLSRDRLIDLLLGEDHSRALTRNWEAEG